MNMLRKSKYGGLTDAQLVTEFQQGEEAGYEILFEKYNKNTLRYLQKLTSEKDYAENLNLTTWLRVYNALLKGQYKETGRFENWVKGIAKRTFDNWCDKKKRELPPASYEYDESVFQIEDENESPVRALERKERTEIIKRLIADLPPVLRRVLELDQKGYTYEDIAKIEGVPVSTIAQRYKRAVRAIQDMLF